MTPLSPALRFCGSRKRARGVAAVEFVITVPVLILLMLAVAELGRALIYFDTLSYSVRSGARFATENVMRAGKLRDDLVADKAGTVRNLVIFGTDTDGGEPLLDEGRERTTVTLSTVGDDSVRIVAEYDYPLLLGVVLPGFTMSVTVTMRAIT